MFIAIFSFFIGTMPINTTAIHHQPATTHVAQAKALPCTGPGCYGSDPRCDNAPGACQ